MKDDKKIFYARIWPREVFYCPIPNENVSNRKERALVSELNKPGVYVLYRNDIPYYIGQTQKLWRRLSEHACTPGARYHNFWNYFSAFVITEKNLRNKVEGILIAAMPTANSAKPGLNKIPFPAAAKRMMSDIYRAQANPKSEFDKVIKLLTRTREKRTKRA